MPNEWCECVRGAYDAFADAVSDLKNEKMNDELWPALLLNKIFFVVISLLFLFPLAGPSSHSLSLSLCRNPL